MATDLSLLTDDVVDTPPPFEGEVVLGFDDYDVKPKDYGFWVLLKFSNENGEKASWSGNLYKAPDTDGRKKAHAIAWRGLREFFKATGMSEGDIPKASALAIGQALDKLVTVNGNPMRVKATLSTDAKGYMNAGRFKAA